MAVLPGQSIPLRPDIIPGTATAAEGPMSLEIVGYRGSGLLYHAAPLRTVSGYEGSSAPLQKPPTAAENWLTPGGRWYPAVAAPGPAEDTGEEPEEWWWWWW